MSFDPTGSTGPHTTSGTARSSGNAIRTGLESPLRGESLYAVRDFIRPGEEEEYSQTLIGLMDELTPEGIVEETFATEIMGATWRLRRCRLVEEAFSGIDDLDFDPMIDEKTEKQQKSVDQARAQSHVILRRSIAELRKLQTDRTLNTNAENPAGDPGNDLKRQPTEPRKRTPDSDSLGLGMGLAGMDALVALADKQLCQQYREGGLSSFCNPGATAPPPASSFCKEPRPIGRNAQCPCGSGVKHKRCCGKDAAPVLNKAA